MRGPLFLDLRAADDGLRVLALSARYGHVAVPKEGRAVTIRQLGKLGGAVKCPLITWMGVGSKADGSNQCGANL